MRRKILKLKTVEIIRDTFIEGEGSLADSGIIWGTYHHFPQAR